MKVLIVEDELPIREWLVFTTEKMPIFQNSVLWADNGHEAYKIFKEERPDIVISDICMPVMDGLELTRQIKAIAPQTQIVLLTCHTDFEYARRALKYGVMEYVLKAEITSTSLFELLSRMVEQVQKDAHKKHEPNALQISRDVYLRQLLDSEDPQFPKEGLREKGISLSEDPFFVIMLKVPKDQMGALKFSIPSDKRVSNVFGFMYHENMLALVGNIKTQASNLMQNYELYEYCKNLQKSLGCFLSCSRIHYDLSHLKTAVQEAYDTMRKVFYLKDPNLLTYENKAYQQMYAQLDQMSKKALEQFKCGLVQEAYQTICQMIASCREQLFPDISYLKNQVSHFLVKSNMDISIVHIEKCENVLELLQIIDTAIEQEKAKASKSYSYPIQKAIEYMRKNFQNPISLGDIAENVGFSPEYFCRLFKSEVGVNFSNYLLKMRLEESARLLKTTHHKVYEIAQMVGYHNLSYYSRIFKKMYGVNPFEFRNSNVTHEL